MSKLRMWVLAESFPSMRGVFPDGWDVETLRKWWNSGAPTHGSIHVARFLLQVWNMHTTAAEWRVFGFKRFESFSVAYALSSWDDEHRRAFVNYCREPFFP